YADSLAAGSIAAGGTLGILIPPSVILVLYGILAGQDIGLLFAAGLLPGLLGIMGYMAAVAAVTRLRPELGPRAQRAGMAERWRTTRQVWGVLLLFVVVMGGIYGGVFTPTEAAGVGAFGSFLFALARRRINARSLIDVLVQATETTAMLFFILIGALLFSGFLNMAGLPDLLAKLVAGIAAPSVAVLACLLVIYLLLGCVLESLAMVLLTVPVFTPIVADLGFDLIWFGIVVVVVTEISLITPPIGLNVFVLRSVLPDVKTGDIFRGVVPFWMADIVRLALIVAVPAIPLALPGTMR
ncbi:MAG TPA: TRAP transporter large permease, partial [Alphaproteobacteria bacterium]|nr:TRAP transporter large permease [Alphaproteobacteria bacterium]